MQMDLLGRSVEDIATVTGYSYDWITHLRCTDRYKNEIAELRKQLNSKIVELTGTIRVEDPVAAYFKRRALDAAKLIGNVMDDSNAEAALRMRAAESILEKAGYGKAPVHVDSLNLQASPEAVGQLTEALQKVGQQNFSVKDIERFVKQGEKKDVNSGGE